MWSRPPTMLSSVVLPEPAGPRMATNSASRKASETSSSATCVKSPVWYDLPIPLSSIMSSPPASFPRNTVLVCDVSSPRRQWNTCSSRRELAHVTCGLRAARWAGCGRLRRRLNSGSAFVRESRSNSLLEVRSCSAGARLHQPVGDFVRECRAIAPTGWFFRAGMPRNRTNWLVFSCGTPAQSHQLVGDFERAGARPLPAAPASERAGVRPLPAELPLQPAHRRVPSVSVVPSRRLGPRLSAFPSLCCRSVEARALRFAQVWRAKMLVNGSASRTEET